MERAKKLKYLKITLGLIAGASALVLLLVTWVYPEIKTALFVLTGLLLAALSLLAWLNQQTLKTAFKTRSIRYGANSVITIALVLAIVVVINFLNFNHNYRKDLTKDKVHSLSDQTVKLLKDLKTDIKITAFVKGQARDQVKQVFDNYTYHANQHLKIEYIDPDREPTRAKAANIKKYGTVILEANKKDTRIEDVTEEKLTNALIKILKEKKVEICFLTGHGEKSVESTEAEGYSQVKTELTAQSYETKNINLLEEGKVPESCSVVLVLGPNKAFFEKEISVLKAWLEVGGKALFALDPNVRTGVDSHSELTSLLDTWFIQVRHNLVLDPTSRLLGVNASVPIVGVYNKEHPVTKEFQVTSLFPLASVVDIKSNPPTSLKTWWLAKSTPKAFSKTDFKEMASGQVRIDPRKDVAASHTMAAAVEGTLDEKVKDGKPARIAVFGTSQLAMNTYARHGANIDLFLNTVSWLADDESMISIRAKEESAQPPTLSQTEGRYVQMLTMFLMPGSFLALGTTVWFRRRKL